MQAEQWAPALTPLVITIAQPTVSIAALNPTIAEDGTTPAVFRVSRGSGDPTTNALVVNYSFSGTATYALDYDAPSSELRDYTRRSALRRFQHPAELDLVSEGNESVFVTLSSSPGYHSISGFAGVDDDHERRHPRRSDHHAAFHEHSGRADRQVHGIRPG